MLLGKLSSWNRPPRPRDFLFCLHINTLNKLSLFFRQCRRSPEPIKKPNIFIGQCRAPYPRLSPREVYCFADGDLKSRHTFGTVWMWVRAKALHVFFSIFCVELKSTMRDARPCTFMLGNIPPPFPFIICNNDSWYIITRWRIIIQ